VDGSPCVVPAGSVVLEAGYRNQVTTGGGTSTLSTYPSPAIRYGIIGGNESCSHPASSTRAEPAPISANVRSGVRNARRRDWIQHSVRDRPWLQDALEVFVTCRRGIPAGRSFTGRGSTYMLGYSASVPVNGRVGLTTTQNFSSGAGINGRGAMARYFSYQPVARRLVRGRKHDHAAPSGATHASDAPGGPTGNRALFGIQQSAGTRIVLDVEFEQNLLPAPGFNQHALGVGLTLRP